MKTIDVRTSSPYRIVVGSGIFPSAVVEACKRFSGRLPIVITNPTIRKLWEKQIKRLIDRLSARLLTVPDSERAKDVRVFTRLVEEVSSLDNARRSVVVIAIGGGVVGDLAGFLAGTYRRGVPIIQVPTSLLAQIDSSIGGKTAINLSSGKNLVGVYHQPCEVVIDTQFLKTLPEEQVKEGIAEGIKYGVIRSPRLFSYLEEQAGNYEEMDWEYFVYSCAKIKADVVSQDERETKGLRYILNFGHTFAHALESASGHRMSHGKAVAIGMVYAGRLSRELGLCGETTLRRLRDLIRAWGLPTEVDLSRLGGVKRVGRFLQKDKKFSEGKARFILVKRIGSVVVSEVDVDLVLKLMSSRHDRR